MSHRVLVVAAHPDDEILGVGATVARHVDAGDTVCSLILAEGAMSREGASPHEVSELAQAAARAAHILGAAAPRFGRFPDQRLDGIDLLDIVRVVEKVAEEVKPTIIYTHHGADLNVDHRRVHAATCTAFRTVPGALITAIYTFETLSSTEWSSPEQSEPFVPQHFVEVTPQLPRKLSALSAYASEMRPFPHPRSYETVEHLARLRGSTIGVAAAEAFGVVRSIWKVP